MEVNPEKPKNLPACIYPTFSEEAAKIFDQIERERERQLKTLTELQCYYPMVKEIMESVKLPVPNSLSCSSNWIKIHITFNERKDFELDCIYPLIEKLNKIFPVISCAAGNPDQSYYFRKKYFEKMIVMMNVEIPKTGIRDVIVTSKTETYTSTVYTAQVKAKRISALLEKLR